MRASGSRTAVALRQAATARFLLAQAVQLYHTHSVVKIRVPDLEECVADVHGAYQTALGYVQELEDTSDD